MRKNVLIALLIIVFALIALKIILTLTRSNEEKDAKKIAIVLEEMPTIIGEHNLPKEFLVNYEFVCLIPPYFSSLSGFNSPYSGELDPLLKSLKFNGSEAFLTVVLVKFKDQHRNRKIGEFEYNRYEMSSFHSLGKNELESFGEFEFQKQMSVMPCVRSAAAVIVAVRDSVRSKKLRKLLVFGESNARN